MVVEVSQANNYMVLGLYMIGTNYYRLPNKARNNSLNL